jgi:Fibronectin type III domain
VRLTPVTNARSYQVQTNTNGNGTWQDMGIFLQARRIVLPGLTPGTTYNVRARAIGGSTGSSEWSPPASIMAT